MSFFSLQYIFECFVKKLYFLVFDVLWNINEKISVERTIGIWYNILQRPLPDRIGELK